MKHCKHFFIFLLVGALLLLPFTSEYAVTWTRWDSFKQTVRALERKVRAFVGEDNMKIAMPAVVAVGLAAGGLYYWWNNRKGGSVSRDGVILQEFPVYSQFSSGGGGNASCGYHVLLRGMQIVNAKSKYENDEELKKTLMDSAAIEVYFGENGEWRQEIIAWRKKWEIKKALHKHFLSVLENNCDGVVQAKYGDGVYQPIIEDLASRTLSGDKAGDLYKSALGGLEDEIIEIANDPNQSNKEYNFSDEAICAQLAELLNRLKTEINKGLIEILQTPEMIKNCFDLNKMREEFSVQDNFFDISAFVKRIYSDPLLQAYFKGEWLDKENIKFLWKKHKKDFIHENIVCHLNAIDDFSLLGNEDFDLTTSFIIKKIKPLLNKNQALFVIFALGTMSQSTKGHWYSLVMYQNENGERSYYTIDSGPWSRLNDANAWKIIDLIEKAEEQI